VTAFEVPVRLGREAAAAAARHELGKAVYQQAKPSLAQRAYQWIGDQLQRLFEGAATASPGGVLGPLVAVALVVLVVVLIRLRVGPLRPSASGDQRLFVGGTRSAADHREQAERMAAAGDWAAALRERLRAVIRSLEERALLDPRPGRTADEAATEAGRVLPDCADGLRAGARPFDDVWYGGHRADADGYASLVELDARVTAGQPVPLAVPVRQ
jgi:hypothetical protein